MSVAGQAPQGSQPAAASPTPAPATALPTIETRDARLGQALAALKAHPTAEAHRRVAAEYRRLQVLDQAYDHLKRASQLEPHDAVAFDGMARIWRDWGFPQLGLGDAYRASSFAPQWAEAQNTLGTILYAVGYPLEAEQHFEIARRLDPGAGYVLNNLCYMALMRGAAQRALDDCQQAVTLSPTLTSARNNLALAYAAAGHEDWAEREFLAAGDRPTGHFNIGVMYLSEREYARAAEAFSAACRERPLLAGACDRAQQASQLANAKK